MSLDFSIIIHVRNQFGTDDLGIGVFAGIEKEFMFDCVNVDATEHALVMFQSRFSDKENIIEINETPIFGGIPIGSPVSGVTTGFPISFQPIEDHSHNISGKLGGWIGNTMVVNKGTLRESGNRLKIKSNSDNFIIDNLTILFKVKQQNVAVDDFFQRNTRE